MVTDLIEQEFCFVHAADLHLGGRLWLRHAPCDAGLAERVRVADRLALTALVNLCLKERATALLCAGDIIDGYCRDYRIGLELVRQLTRLRDATCAVALVLGNHDVRTRVARPLLLPEHVTWVGLSGPETLVLEPLGVALHGWSFPDVPEGFDVAERYPAPLPGFFNIGLLHTSAEGRHGHSPYAPCSRRTLRRHGYDYWALGHVHAREIIATEPYIVFPGNLQGRGARESGAKGATVVRVRNGRVVSAEHQPLDAVRFATMTLDTSSVERFEDVLSMAALSLARAAREAEGRPVVARLILSGEAGASQTLSVPPKRRRDAFQAVARRLGDGVVCLDEIRIEVGSWCVDAA